MPLPEPVARNLIHTRQIECKGYEREDGLWDIEASLLDTKSEAHTRRAGGAPRLPGEAIHHMWLRLTIDLDMLIHDAEAATVASPYVTCGAITPNFKRLRGLTIGPGWRRKTMELLGGTEGCTHLVELLGPLGTTAFQSTGRAREARLGGKPVTKRPYQLNSCHMYRDDSEAVLERWPQFYTGPRNPEQSGHDG